MIIHLIYVKHHITVKITSIAKVYVLKFCIHHSTFSIIVIIFCFFIRGDICIQVVRAAKTKFLQFSVAKFEKRYAFCPVSEIPLLNELRNTRTVRIKIFNISYKSR